MSRGVYFNLGSGIKQPKKVYCGVGGVHRVKKKYVGVGGVPKLGYSADVEYKGTTTPLDDVKISHGAGSTPDYAIFAFGQTAEDSSWDYYSDPINAYSKSLTKTTVSYSSYDESYHSVVSASVGNYAMFGGFYKYDYFHDGTGWSWTRRGMPKAISNSLVFSTASPIDEIANNYSAASNGNYAIFAGGAQQGGYPHAQVSAYNGSLVKTKATDLIEARSNATGVRIGNYALFVGGYVYDSYYTGAVDAYNSSLVRSNPSWISESTSSLNSASNSKYAYIAISGSRHLDVYNTSLVKTTITNALASSYSSYHSYDSSCVSTSDYAFIGGQGNNYIEVFDTNSVKQTFTLSKYRTAYQGAQVGFYVLLGGGKANDLGISPSITNMVDVFEI